MLSIRLFYIFICQLSSVDGYCNSFWDGRLWNTALVMMKVGYFLGLQILRPTLQEDLCGQLLKSTASAIAWTL